MTGLPPQYDQAFAALGDVVNAANEVGDTELAELALNGQRLINDRKEPSEPAGVRVWSEAEIVAALTAAAGERNVPAALLVGAAIAESGLDQFAERLGTWPDVSFGLGQQTVKWAPVGDGSASEENVALVRDYFSDPANAIPVMADKLAYYYHHPANPGTSPDERVMAALSKYNANQWEIPESHRANVENYLRSLAQADRMLAEP